ncbi:Inherit from COG: Phosphoglycerate mutase [Seminavis robusta]|uniref:Inherit from COG: Phosphoglycerate mutase n=1 Tax=Seminavis robusta TaxID=568900 RepID=A0A9N8HFB3_9STRA|nr:Inherit from COG: Phosphoglycerate mutase [Seminavis robusta]|eukprot:Sro341_g121630.1 Inherit from COG: Phosphoglycerate mutase (366) ;mRNA; f:74192-75414
MVSAFAVWAISLWVLWTPSSIVQSFTVQSSSVSCHYKSTSRRGAVTNEDHDHDEDSVVPKEQFNSSIDPWNRRQVLSYGSSLALATTSFHRPSNAIATTTDNYLDALVDLPPLATDTCRIFFCRHGQTENNRLRLVQGARVNAPLNELGRQQGYRTGLALANALPVTPSLVYCSPLVRARQTAQQARNAMMGKQQEEEELQALDALMEVDFGPVAEGQRVDDAKPGMMATYARWSMGDVDFRPEGGGDSGRDVIYRAVQAVETLAKAAASDECPNRCVAAFTHSQYLRMLLAVFLGKSLVEGANLVTANGSINVLDVNLSGKTQTVGPKSRLVGGFLSQAPRDFSLEIPKATVVRINEVRHLEGL